MYMMLIFYALAMQYIYTLCRFTAFCQIHLSQLTVLDVLGAEGLVKLTISCIANRNFNLCNGLLMPISRCISWSDRADIIAPLFTLARHAATYQAGIPTHS